MPAARLYYKKNRQEFNSWPANLCDLVKVFVDVPNATLREPFEVKIRAEAQGCDVKYDRVYLQVEGIESVEVQDYDFEYDEDGTRKSRREVVRKSATTYDIEMAVAGPGVLKEGETGEWTVEVRLPEGATPEFRGKFARYRYRVFAGLDCFGNDPDSGWVDIRVS